MVWKSNTWLPTGRRWPLALLLAFVWLGLLFDPIVGPPLLGILAAIGVTLALVVGAMLLGMMGFGLFAIGDHFIGWMQRGRKWPSE
jgi:hypothetical protein